MKPISVSGVITIVFTFLSSIVSQAQTFGTSASAVWLSDCNQSNYFNTSGSGSTLIGPSANLFTNASLGAHTQNSGTLILRGGEVRTFKTPGVANVCSARMYYRIYLQSGTPGSFNFIDLPFSDDCTIPLGQFPSGGSCLAGDQKWKRVIADGETTPNAPIDLTAFAAGNYIVEVYYELTGSSVSTSLCDETVVLNNAGNNYKAYFTIQSPILNSTNPTNCNGADGYITISGLAAGASYTISYTKEGTTVGPNTFIANGAGQVLISGLNAGIYSDFELSVNGCLTQLNTGLILSNPIVIPTFNTIAPICAGSTPPVLPTTSKNGISGTWNPSVIDNQTSGTYTFTPSAGQCGITVTRNVTVNPMITPVFSFGTSLSICEGGTVPALPGTSFNGITGSWSPATVDNQNSATYTFTPSTGQCATPTTFTVTVNPNITPVFGFGTAVSICAGAGVPVLPGTSDNGISGSWSPATVDNQNSGTYTFTPSGGQCGTTTTFAVTVTPNATPVFSFGTALTICAGDAVPALTNTSTNGINGTWSPAMVDNQSSGTYTFTPSAGQCATTSVFTVSVNPNINPTFSFGTTLTICAGETVPALPNTSTNGITGTWSPATVDNQNSGTYSFTPAAGQCAIAATFTVTVNPNITPAFSFGTSLSICAGGTVPALPGTSTNGITGTWSPSTVDNQNSATYTFTPTAGLCATSTSFTVTVNSNITPVFGFGTSLTICAGGAVPTLPNTSTNGITGSWSPSAVDNQNSGTYNFTPDAGQCAVAATFTLTVNPNITPTFSYGTTLSICSGGTVPVLNNTSTNGISGTWSPSTVDNQNSGTYTFTPNAGQCATTAGFVVTVNSIVTPAFSFGSTLSICAGGTVPALPSTSSNNITGVWSPSVVDNQASGTYTFTPNAGQCATTISITVNVNSNTNPVFSFGTSLSICEGGTVPSLPATSTNGINGTWTPATVSNVNSATYTFTPASGQCATPATFSVIVNSNATPAFSFGSSLSICTGGTVPSLPATSGNGISGTWSPAIVDNQNSGSYTFTPDAGQCAVTKTLTVTVNPNITPTFSFGTALTICAGASVPALSGTSGNGITGTWSPAMVDNQNSGTYTFTPSAGQCATTTTFTLTVNPNTTPVFSFGTSLTICEGGSVPVLPTTSDNGISGSWSPAVVDNQSSGIYTFIPSVLPGQCITAASYTVNVIPILTPTFSFGTAVTICAGSTAPVLPNMSANGITGTWSPATIDNQNSATYTFTTAPGQCATAGTTVSVTVNPVPTVNSGPDITVNDGIIIPANDLSGSPASVDFTWTNSNPAIGLAASGTGDVPSFTAINQGSDPRSGTITIIPMLNGCAGTARSYVITVIPLEKDVFVPNVFTPNGDGKNDLLLVYGNYIAKLEMRIFNQWGEQVELVTSANKGWDGKHKGRPQPVGVYVYTLQAVLTDGRTIKMKGNITLLR